MSEIVNILATLMNTPDMKRLIVGLMVCLIFTSVRGQEQVKNLGLQEREYGLLSDRIKEQFVKDIQMIEGDSKLRELYSLEVKKVIQSFSGTREERAQTLAKIARTLVSREESADRPTPLDPERSGSVSEQMQRPKVVNRAIRVTPDILISRDEESSGQRGDTGKVEEMVVPEDQYKHDPQPMNPVQSGANVFQGHIAYEIPDTMEVGKTSRIRMVVSIDPEIARQLAERNEGDMYSDEIGIGRYLKARLDDYDSFGADDKNFMFQLFQGDSIQVINPDDPRAAVVWEWKVRPLNVGVHTIGVVVSIIVFDDRLPGDMGYRSLDTYEQPIRILATQHASGGAGNLVAGKPGTQRSVTPRQLIGAGIGVVALGILAFFFARWRRTRALRAQAATEAPVNPLAPEVRQGDGHADPDEINALILAGKFDKAAGELMDLAEIRKYPEKSAIITLQARINHWQADVHNNLIDGESARQERSRITMALVHLLDEIVKG